MPVTATPIFTQAVNNGIAICTAAETSYTAPTTRQLLLTAGANGSLMKSVKAIPRATVTATQLQLYSSKDAGVTFQLLPYSAVMTAYTLAATTAVPATDLGISNRRLAPGERIYASIGVALANGIVFDAEYEDF